MAEQITDSHEVTGLQNGGSQGDLHMDLFNNLAGRLLFQREGNTNFTGNEVVQIVLNELIANRVITEVPESCAE